MRSAPPRAETDHREQVRWADEAHWRWRTEVQQRHHFQVAVTLPEVREELEKDPGPAVVHFPIY